MSQDVVDQVIVATASTLVASAVCWFFAQVTAARESFRKAGIAACGLCAVILAAAIASRAYSAWTAASAPLPESPPQAQPVASAEPSPRRETAMVAANVAPSVERSGSNPRRTADASPSPWSEWLPAGRAGGYAVLVVDASGRIDAEVSAALARAVGGGTDAFAEAFVSSGAFGRLYSGDTSDLRDADAARLPRLVLGKSTTSLRPQDALSSGLRTVELVVDVRRFAPSEGLRSEVLRFAGKGADFSDSGARANACAELTRQAVSLAQ